MTQPKKTLIKHHVFRGDEKYLFSFFLDKQMKTKSILCKL